MKGKKLKKCIVGTIIFFDWMLWRISRLCCPSMV